MSNNKQIVILALSLVSASYVAHERRRTEEAIEFFEATFPDDAASLVLDTQAEVVEVAS